MLKLESLHTSLDHLLHDERSHIVGIGVHAETGVKAQFLGQLVGDAGAATAADHLVAQALGLHQLDELGHILDVDVLLGHRLRDEQGVGMELFILAASKV